MRTRIGCWLGYGEVSGRITPIWLMLLFQPYRLGCKLHWWRQRRGESYAPLDEGEVA